LLELCEKHTVRFEWIRGHNGHAENECCDRLAGLAARQSGLPVDVVYEKV
jgi:ribonuclease HI